MDIVSKMNGSQLQATEFNQIPDECENLIASGGLIPSDAVLTQMADAVAQISADGRFFATSGSADAIILSQQGQRKAIKSLTNGVNGMFRAIHDNTGAVTVNLCNLGAKSVFKDSSALIAGDIKSGNYYNFIYDATNDRFEIAEYLNKSVSTEVKDFGYKQNDFIQAYNKTSLVIKAGTEIKLNVSGEEEARVFNTNEDTTFVLSEILDTGSVQAGKDYCIYLVAGIGKSVDVKASLNTTFPQGYTADNSRKIGGCHTLCVSVTSSNAPVLVDNNIWSAHPAIGFSAGDIIPNSVWCLAHRPISDPSGMVYVDKINMWVDIYLQSGTGTGTASVYGATVTSTRTQIQHQWDMQLVNKKLATDNDFMMFAEGSNQKTAIAGAKEPNPKIAGGHLDTAGKRMISGYFIEECCGYLWQWLDEIAPVGGSGFASYRDEGTRGQSYGMPYCLGAGGDWGYSSSCGSRSRSANGTRSVAGADVGARGVSRPLILDR